MFTAKSEECDYVIHNYMLNKRCPLIFLNCLSCYRDSNCQRTFFINRNYGGCQVDAGWFVVIDSGNSYMCCPYQWSDTGTTPAFIYSKKSGFVNYEYEANGTSTLYIYILTSLFRLYSLIWSISIICKRDKITLLLYPVNKVKPIEGLHVACHGKLKLLKTNS